MLAVLLFRGCITGLRKEPNLKKLKYFCNFSNIFTIYIHRFDALKVFVFKNIFNSHNDLYVLLKEKLEQQQIHKNLTLISFMKESTREFE